MKLKTISVRRSRPSALSLALALMLTMLCVYVCSLPSQESTQQAAAQTPAAADVYLPGLDVFFHCEGRYSQELDAHLAAARCVQAGGAGLVLEQDGQYAVVSHAGGRKGESGFQRSAGGLTLHASGSSGEITALNDAAAFLQALHTETASLAESLLRGDTNASSISVLMEIYRTRGKRILDSMETAESGHAVMNALAECVERALDCIRCTGESPSPSHLRLLHAAACADWLDLLETLQAMNA